MKNLRIAALCVMMGIGVTTGQTDRAQAADATRAPFGALADGTVIESVTLTNAHGMSARIMTLGAALQSLIVPDRQGHGDDIVLGYDTAAEYLAKPQYFGATVGRYANRIAHGRFTLDGHDYTLETNNGANHLHGGTRGFDKRVWTIQSVSGGAESSVTLAYRSPDGEGGYPGTLTVTATYALSEANALSITYRATTDRPTIVNVTNHSFFNLSGAHGATDALGALLTLHATAYTPVDDGLIPTGEIRPVAGTPFDFRNATAIGARVRDGSDAQMRIGRGYDHNFVVDGAPGTLRPVLRLEDPRSGRVMEMSATAPSVQFYSGNFLDGTVTGKQGRIYRQGDGLAFEPQVYPDSPNHPAFPSARLDPGQTYTNRMVLRFSTAAAE
jgi:aldose 1-epimerase